MTDSNSKTQPTAPEHKSGTERKIVYIRKVAVEELPQEVQEQAQGLTALYAIGGEDGKHLALVRDRELAFVVARQNDMQPLSVH